MAVGIIAVARQAGVSITTVSRVFNVPASVAPATRAAVQAAALALGYVPNVSARTLRTQRSRALGVMLPTLHNPVFAECLSGIAAAAADLGYSIIPLTTDYLAVQEQRAVERLTARAVDGLILTVANAAASPTLAVLRRSRLPYVLAYNRHARHPCVSVDGEAAVGELVARLRRLGHEGIAMVSGMLAASDRAQQRFRGYSAAIRRDGGRAELIEVPFVESAVETLVQRLRRLPRPTALICSNDLLAVRCLRAAALAGLHVPDDLSIVGFDGIGLGPDLRPSLASIAQPNEEIGRRCVTWLIGCLASGTLPRASGNLTLPHELRLLESIGIAPSAATASATRRTSRQRIRFTVTRTTRSSS